MIKKNCMKRHSLFTNTLLKKIKETIGNVSYKELSDYISRKVSVKTILINNKKQTPQILFSPDVEKTWTDWKVR
jgi:hypothetical protein